MKVLQIVSGAAILILGLVVALTPNLVYAPAPRVILFFLVAIFPAILFGSLVTANLEVKGPWFVFTTTGVFAVCLAGLLTLDHLAKPQEKIAVYQVFDSNDEPLNLEAKSAVEVPVTESGLTVTKFVDGNTIVLIFPEQTGKAEIRVKPISTAAAYTGEVTYAGSRRSKLFIGRDLKQGQ
jgi:hypothetical protein